MMMMRMIWGLLTAAAGIGVGMGAEYRVEGQTGWGGGVSSSGSYWILGIANGSSGGAVSGGPYQVLSLGVSFLVPTPATVPTLRVEARDGRVVLRWSAEAMTGVLEESSTLEAPDGWKTSAAVPRRVDGEWMVELGSADRMLFVRLRRP